MTRARKSAVPAVELGTASDATLAQRYKLTAQAVAKQRKRHGIPSFQAQQRKACWTKQRVSKLGKQSDAKLAKAWGMKTHQVRDKRRALAIEPMPAHRRRRGSARSVRG